MDGRDDRATLLASQVAKNLHDAGGREGVETCGGLIEENQTGVSDKLDTNRCALALTARYTLDEGTTDASLLTLDQLEILDQLGHTRQFGFNGARELQLRSKFEALAHSHGLEQNIILLYVGGHGGEIANLFLGLAINRDLTCLTKIRRDLATGQEVKESGLTGARRTNNSQELARHDSAAHALNNLLRFSFRGVFLALRLGRLSRDFDIAPGNLHRILSLVAHA